MRQYEELLRSIGVNAKQHIDEDWILGIIESKDSSLKISFDYNRMKPEINCETSCLDCLLNAMCMFFGKSTLEVSVIEAYRKNYLHPEWFV